MCGNQGQEDNGYGARFLQGEYADVFLQRLDLCPGYSIAIWKHGHVAELTELTPSGLQGFTEETIRASRAIEATFRPAKMNFETLGNALPHLHTHIVPRYLGDPAPGRPLLGAPGVEPQHNLPESVFNETLAALRRGVEASK